MLAIGYKKLTIEPNPKTEIKRGSITAIKTDQLVSTPNLFKANRLVHTKEKKVVIQPEKITNLISIEKGKPEIDSSGICSLIDSGLDSKTMLVINNKAESTKLEIKLTLAFCFFVRFSPVFDITIPENEKFNKMYKTEKKAPANAF